MTYPDAIQFLYDLRLFGAKFGLENTFRLAGLAGNPQHRLRFIHVAGTNGKGSVCAMLESIYRSAGLRVGLFTSPHLVKFGERIQVNRELISEPDIVRLVGKMQRLLAERWPNGTQPPTFFEVVTVMALLYFQEQKCDLVIWETGLGGRLDATNIVTPLASVITNVQFDHQQWLGDTLTAIASEKAGIIKPDVSILTAADDAEALRVIGDTARKTNAPLTIVAAPVRDAKQTPALEPKLPLPGRHQRLNAALATAVVHALAGKIPVSEEALERGLATVNWPGRLQLVTEPSGRKILLDGAHNDAGAKTLVESLPEILPATPPALILGVLQDKDWRSICNVLAPCAKRIVLVPAPSDRTANPAELLAACREANSSARIEACKSLAAALDALSSEPFVVVTGSLYLVGEALELLEKSRPAREERSLNEWAARPQS